MGYSIGEIVINEDDVREFIDPDAIENSDLLFIDRFYIDKDERFVYTDESFGIEDTQGYKFYGWIDEKPLEKLYFTTANDGWVFRLCVQSVATGIKQTISIFDICAIKPKIYKQDEKDNTENVTLKSFVYNTIKEAIEKGDITLADLWLEIEVIYMIMIDMMNKESE